MAGLIYSKNVPDGIMKEEFDGALCDKPIPGDKFELPEDCDHPTDVKNEKPMEEDVTILKHREYEDVTVKGCKIFKSEVITECWKGTFNTEEFLSNIEIEVPLYVTQQECRRMISTGTFKDKRGNVHKLDGPHGSTNFQVVNIGDLQVKDHETYCYGQDAYYKGQFRTNIVAHDYYNVFITKAVARFGKRENEAEILDTGDRIRCNKEDEACLDSANDVTYVWTNPGESCPLVVANRILGHRENEHFVSNKAGIYLRMHTPEVIPHCNFQVYRTDIANYYIIESDKAEKHGHELKKFNPDDFSEHDWAWSRDKYSRYEQGIKRVEENRAQSIAFCKHMQNQHVAGLSLTEKGSSNIIPGNAVGSYLSVEGEMLGAFTCPVVSVHPRKIDFCTYELPVTYKGQNYFLTPISRILSKSYTVAVCSEAGGAKYKSKGGRYVRANPSITYVEKPKKRKSTFLKQEEDEEEEEGTKYGLFSEKDTEDYAHHLHFKSYKHEILTKLTNQWCTKNSPEGCGYAGNVAYSPIEITDEEEDDTWNSLLKGVINFGGYWSGLAWFNWGYEIIMKVFFGISVVYNLWYYFGSKCFNKRRSDSRTENINIDIENGQRPPVDEEERQLALLGRWGSGDDKVSRV